MKGDALDPKALIREAYRIDGITEQTILRRHCDHVLGTNGIPQELALRPVPEQDLIGRDILINEQPAELHVSLLGKLLEPALLDIDGVRLVVGRNTGVAEQSHCETQ